MIWRNHSRVKKTNLGIKEDGMGDVILSRVVMTSLIELLTFEQSLKEARGRTHAIILVESI